MKIAKRFPDTMTAHMARALLEAEGIEAFIADENLANADPPVIFASGGVRLMVPDKDLARAQEIMSRPAEFEWPEEFEMPGEAPAMKASTPSQHVPVQMARTPSWLSKGLWLVVGVVLGSWLAHWRSTDNALAALSGDGEIKEDSDRNGKVDRITMWKGGEPASERMDIDGDGIFETSVTFEGARSVQASDVDGDEAPDIRFFYDGIRWLRTDWMKDGRVFKRARTKGLLLDTVEIDHDGDGIFEERRRYDRYEEVIPDGA